MERGGDHGILGREDLLLRGVHRDQELGADRRPLPGNEKGRGPHESFHKPGAGVGGGQPDHEVCCFVINNCNYRLFFSF